MSISERERVLARREGFEQGAQWNEVEHRASPNCHHSMNQIPHQAAERFYPLPQIERPRVVTDSEGYQWRVTKHAGLQMKLLAGTCWLVPGSGAFNARLLPETARIIQDLLTRPTEMADDDGSLSSEGHEK